jgi:hypothetical protein
MTTYLIEKNDTLSAQAATLPFRGVKGTADAYPTTEDRLRCLVLSGGAAHIPMDDKLDILDIIAKLDTGIWAAEITASMVLLRCLVRRGGAAHSPMDERLEREDVIDILDWGTLRSGV